jgi:hypothetical protein
MTQQLNFRFRAQPSVTSPDGILLSYLNDQLPSVKSEMILKALRAYWLAEAYQASNKKRGQELKKLAQQMIFSLEEQIAYLRVVFNLPAANSMRTSPSVSVSSRVVSEPLPEPLEEEDEESQEDWDSVPVIDMDMGMN